MVELLDAVQELVIAGWPYQVNARRKLQMKALLGEAQEQRANIAEMIDYCSQTRTARFGDSDDDQTAPWPTS